MDAYLTSADAAALPLRAAVPSRTGRNKLVLSSPSSDKAEWHGHPGVRRLQIEMTRRYYMKGYKEPGFQDRAAASAHAKDSALKQMKAAPKPGKAELAAGAARQAEREAKAASKRAAAREAQEKSEREAREIALDAEKEQARAEMPALTEADKKAARDVRYAARKSRKSGRS